MLPQSVCQRPHLFGSYMPDNNEQTEKQIDIPKDQIIPGQQVQFPVTVRKLS